jgi:Helicase associated domain
MRGVVIPSSPEMRTWCEFQTTMKSSFDGPNFEKIGLRDIRRIQPIPQQDPPQPNPINMLFKEVVHEYHLEGAANHMSSPERSMLIGDFLPLIARSSSQEMAHDEDGGLGFSQNEWRPQPSSNTSVAHAVSPPKKLLARKGDDQVLPSRATKRSRPSPEPQDNEDDDDDNDEEEDHSESSTNWFSQVDMWQTRLEELILYRQNNGHCRVPHKWKENVALSHWVKRYEPLCPKPVNQIEKGHLCIIVPPLNSCADTKPLLPSFLVFGATNTTGSGTRCD